MKIFQKLQQLWDRKVRTLFFKPKAGVVMFSEAFRRKYDSAYDYWRAVGFERRRAYLKSRGKRLVGRRKR